MSSGAQNRTGDYHARHSSFAHRHIHPRSRRAGRRANPAGSSGASRQSAARTRRRMQDEGAIIVTATKRASTVQDVPFSINAQTQADIQRANAQTIEDISRNVAGLTVQNLGPGPEPGLGPRRFRRPDRPRPAGREGTGRHLPRRKRRLAVAVHAGFRPVRPQPRRDAARAAGHVVRLGLGRRHHPLHHQPAQARAVEGQVEAGVNVAKGGDIGYDAKGALNIPIGNVAAVRGVGLLHALSAASSTPSARRQARTSTMASATAAACRCCCSRPTISRSRRASFSSGRRANGFNREEFYNLYDNQFTSGAAGTDLGRADDLSEASGALQGPDVACRPDGRLRFRPGRADVGQQLHASQHPRQPRRVGADRLGQRVDLGFPPAGIEPAVEPARHDQARPVHAGTAARVDRQRAVPMGVRRLLQPRRPRLSPAPADPGL